MPMLSSFDNQGFLVVNGTQGIMPALVLRAARLNASVVFTVTPDRCADAQQLVRHASTVGLSERLSFIVAEPDEEGVEALFDTALDRLAGLNVLIHNLDTNAYNRDRSLLEISLAEWNAVLSTELRLPFLTARRAIEEFICGAGPGRIVYVAYSGSAPCAPAAMFAAAQTGLHALARCINKEFGRREVACNAVIINDDRGMKMDGFGIDDGAPPELVETVLFLASPGASFVNGELLQIGRGPGTGTSSESLGGETRC